MSYIPALPSNTNIAVTLDDTVYMRRTGTTVIGNIVLDGANIVLNGNERIAGRRVDQDGLVLDTINTGIGILVRSGDSAFKRVSIVGAAGEIDVSNADGASGNPTLSLAPTGISGSYTRVSTDTKGRVISGSNPTTLTGYGITDAVNTSNLSSANTPNSVVYRDATGSFAANVITANSLNGALTGNASSATKLVTPRNINGVPFDGTADISFTTSAVAEGTNLYYTQARFNAALSAKTTTDLAEGSNLYFTVSRAHDSINVSGVGLSYSAGVITSNATTTNTPSTIVSRNASGGFSADVITASLTGNATTATTLQTGRTISVTGDATGTSASFNGSANASIALTLGTVNGSVGSFGSSTAVPVITANSKGLVTSITTTPITFPVTSVAGKTGAVTLANVDVGLGNVENKTSETIRNEITSLNVRTALGFTPENPVNKNVANGYAGLGSDGKLLPSQIPVLAITETFVISSEAAMLALSTAETGDVAIRTDLNKTFILRSGSPSVLSNWQELLSPTAAVTSVAGKVGAVTLNSSDVGLSNLSNSLQVVNAGTVPSIASGVLASRPAAGVIGRLYLVSSTLEIFRDTGASWDLVRGPTIGDVTSASGSNVTTLSNFGPGAGTYGAVTIDAKGRVSNGGKFYSGIFASSSGTTTLPIATVPSSNDGTQIVTSTITPMSTTSRMVFDVSTSLATANNDKMMAVAIYRDNICINAYNHNGFDRAVFVRFQVVDTPNTLSPVTYSVRVGVAPGTGTTWYVGTDKAGPYFGGASRSTWTITEYL
jgi:hypothetical protein